MLMRWWWFGPSVPKDELERELRFMKTGGIGGVEVQTTYPLALDNPAIGFRNYSFLSNEYLETLRFASERARELGLRFDLTLGSGWPYGGLSVPVTQAAGMLRVLAVPAPEGADSIALPHMEDGEEFLAAFLARAAGSKTGTEKPQQLFELRDGRLPLPRLDGPRDVLFFIASRTGQQVKRPAIGAEGFVLDHYDRNAIENYLHAVGDRLMQAFGSHPPYSIFSDSLEVYGSDWTSNFLQEFRRRRGYDLTPHLPRLVGESGPIAAEIRHDWGQTLSELANENYLAPIREWAARHGTRFRSQTYGIPPVRLSSNALVDLPEGEGWNWQGFSAVRWAASASHLYGRQVTSSETWTWLHSPVFRATPLDMKAAADAYFLEGSNQLIGHGWPYSPAWAGEPGWRFYAAAVFNQHNPWWVVMPDVARYLQRVSFLLRQGKPASNMALLLPTDDAWAQLVATGQLPSRAPGLKRTETDSPRVQQISQHLFLAPGARGHFLADETHLGETLARLMKPDATLSPPIPEVGFVHRRLPFADVYFLANTKNQRIHTQATFSVSANRVELWDPISGKTQFLEATSPINLTLEPYQSCVLVFYQQRSPLAGPQLHLAKSKALPPALDLASDWSVEFPGLGRTIKMAQLHSWTDDAETEFYSGLAVYEKGVTVPAILLKPGINLDLDFGCGTPIELSATRPDLRPDGTGSGLPRMQAWPDSPVREAAQIFVNERLASTVWLPPYEVDVTKLLHPGTNKLRIVVGNLAVNEMAGRALPDYRLLNDRYGERFHPQDLANLQPVASGILGKLRLVPRAAP